MELRQNGVVIRYDASLIDPMEPRLFDTTWLRENGLDRGGATGRGEAVFFSHNGRDMVLRHFRRGGLVGRVNRNSYLRLGAARSRSMQEYDLLHWMKEEGLLVPTPVASLYSPAGPIYRAALITERIADAQPLEDILLNAALPETLWVATGVAIRKLHDKGVYHSDLNCRNILIGKENAVWLIDFDKCRRRAAGPWTGENLDRLKRSLRKDPRLNWHEDDWAALEQGYKAGDGPSDSPRL